MNEIEADTKGGFNSLLAEHRDGADEVTVTLYDFNSEVERVFQARPVEDAPKLTDDNYTPGGRTALHDAMATAIRETGKRISERSESNRPDHVLFVVLTDGKENASETPVDTVEELVELKRTEENWEFLFIGANQDAVLTAEELGMEEDRALTMSHTDEGARSAYESTSEQLRQMRERGTTDGFDETDRQRQRDADDR